MVKRDLQPIGFIVAICTLGPQAFFVNVVVTMTADAVARCVTMFVRGFMAVGALCFYMLAPQLKVSEKMIKC